MRAILSEFTLENFKSYRTGRLPLGPLTVMIGANASGKSNALEGLRFLSWLAQRQKLTSIQHTVNAADRIVRGRVDDLCYRGETSFSVGCALQASEWNSLSMTLTLRDGDLHISHESITNTESQKLYELDQPSQGVGTDVSVAYNPFDRGQNQPHIVCSDQRAIFMQLDSPATFTTEKRLQGDGTNLSSVLYRLWHEAEANQQAILDFIQSLPEQAITGIDFLTGSRGEVMVQLQESFGATERYCEAALLSDGTLRVLAIAAAMLSATEGSLVVIEEIDNGVHPSRAEHLLTRIRAIAERRNLRVLLFTHNPALMDALPDAALGDVVFCYRDPQEGHSRLGKLGEIDDFPGLVSQGPLGQLVTTGVVDRFIKSPIPPEERKQRAMSWLSSLRSHPA